MKIKKFVLGFFCVNCYILNVNNLNIIIDAGADFNLIKKHFDEIGETPDFILNTHGHYDHIGAVPELISNYKIPFYIHEADEFIIKDADKNLSSFFGGNELSLKTYNLIKNNNFEYFEKKGLGLFHMPGHTPGSIVIVADNHLFTGDLLFRCSIGRTDLPGGDSKAIRNSLEQIRKFDKHLIIHPGHGESSAMDFELKNNYYLSDEFFSQQ